MDYVMFRSWAIKITHIPTGIIVIRDSTHFRSQHEAHEAALKYLKSKLLSLSLPYTSVDVTYNLPDDVTHPNDLSDYKK